MKSYFSWLAKVITGIFLLCFVAPIVFLTTIGSMVPSDEIKDLSNDKEVAVISLDGIITDSKDIVSSLYKQAQNDKVKGIVLRINSPGGAVGPSQDIYAAVKKLKAKKPIIASMGTVAASGGFYSALGASKVFCQPGTLTGSIGVILQIPNFEKIADKVGFEMVTVKSGALKDVGNSFRPMLPEEREYLQGTVMTVYDDFVKAIVESRGIPLEQVKTFADGRIIVGTQAKELKIVDEFGDVYDAARAVFDILGTPLKADEIPKLVYPDEKFGGIKKLFEAATKIPQLLTPQVSFNYVM
jgi:protease-4